MSLVDASGHHTLWPPYFRVEFYAGINLLQRNISGDAFHNSEQRFPPPRCHPDTRTAVQNRIESWAANTDGRAPAVMWLYGPAGAGKSAIAQSMAENWTVNSKLAAAFFARWRTGGSSGKSPFPTIAYQLALHNPNLRQCIGLAVEADPAICDKALEEQFQALIVNPMGQLEIELSSPYLIIIDGWMNVTASQCRAASSHLYSKHSLKITCLSGNVEFRRLALDETFDPGRDIQRPLRDRFSEIRGKRLPYHDASWPSERDLETLVHNASGQFIYAATVVKFLDDEYCHPVEQLCTVLGLSITETNTSPYADLDRLYVHILSTNPNIFLLKHILGAYFALPNPESVGIAKYYRFGDLDEITTHCVGFLDGILGLHRGSARFSLRGMHSILFIPDTDDRRIRVHHASVYDFLSNPARAGRFYLSNEVHHMGLARHCLSIVIDSVYHPEQYTLSLLSPEANGISATQLLGWDPIQSSRNLAAPSEVQMLVIHSGYDDIHAVEDSAESVRLRRLRAVDDRVYVAVANPAAWSEEELAQAWSDEIQSGESVWDRAPRDTQAWLAQFDQSG
ncbi:hypothetical protein B0H13DRAFT_2551360 [Mycena leptocephala]|nr:hypothetical protein B0H13DRAFT_2551360 [Mycena leptocephala]